MGPEGSSPYSQEPFTGPYLKPVHTILSYFSIVKYSEIGKVDGCISRLTRRNNTEDSYIYLCLELEVETTNAVFER
jgi:predicted transcriptional regulator with HTH domain